MPLPFPSPPSRLHLSLSSPSPRTPTVAIDCRPYGSVGMEFHSSPPLACSSCPPTSIQLAPSHSSTSSTRLPSSPHPSIHPSNDDIPGMSSLWPPCSSPRKLSLASNVNRSPRLPSTRIGGDGISSLSITSSRPSTTPPPYSLFPRWFCPPTTSSSSPSHHPTTPTPTSPSSLSRGFHHLQHQHQRHSSNVVPVDWWGWDLVPLHPFSDRLPSIRIGGDGISFLSTSCLLFTPTHIHPTRSFALTHLEDTSALVTSSIIHPSIHPSIHPTMTFLECHRCGHLVPHLANSPWPPTSTAALDCHPHGSVGMGFHSSPPLTSTHPHHILNASIQRRSSWNIVVGFTSFFPPRVFLRTHQLHDTSTLTILSMDLSNDETSAIVVSLSSPPLSMRMSRGLARDPPAEL
ncbi:hypothetical protein BKA70DRAFT_1430520 [Coprinopsis sp. MPI-PUGE-AT-0042]|nr:hypothetical protein BKA70DRAFT_1430520 [Coprinopsis sp. MPI-PUGE-AT-0042]